MPKIRILFISLYIIMGNASGKPETKHDNGRVTAKRHHLGHKHKHQQSHKHHNKHWHGFRTRHRHRRYGGSSPRGVTKKVYRQSPLNPSRSRVLADDEADAAVGLEKVKVKEIEQPMRESLLISQHNSKIRKIQAKREASEKRKAMELQAKMEALSDEHEAQAAAEKKAKEAESERKRKSAMREARKKLEAMAPQDPDDY